MYICEGFHRMSSVFTHAKRMLGNVPHLPIPHSPFSLPLPLRLDLEEPLYLALSSLGSSSPSTKVSSVGTFLDDRPKRLRRLRGGALPGIFSVCSIPAPGLTTFGSS